MRPTKNTLTHQISVRPRGHKILHDIESFRINAQALPLNIPAFKRGPVSVRANT